MESDGSAGSGRCRNDAKGLDDNGAPEIVRHESISVAVGVEDFHSLTFVQILQPYYVINF